MNYKCDIDNMGFESIGQKEENSTKINQLKAHNRSEIKETGPVYGQILTADQLSQFNSQNISIDSKKSEYVNLSLIKDGTVKTSSSSSLSSSNINETSKRLSAVPYYHYPEFPFTNNQQNLKLNPQRTKNPLYENTSQMSISSSSSCQSTQLPLRRNRISIKLSLDLITTYKAINEVYYQNKRKNQYQLDDNINKNIQKNVDQNLKEKNISKNTSHHSNSTISHHHHHHHHQLHPTKQQLPLPENTSSMKGGEGSHEYSVKPGEVWKLRYCIEQLIGTGSFGQVVKAKDLQTQENVAIKIIKNKRNFVEQAYTEIEILKEMAKYQATDEMAKEWGANYIVKLKTSFMHHGHLCLVFELLTYNLYDLLKNTSFRGVSLNLTRKFGNQICEALAFLSKPQTQIIHCDLKPENILLIHPRRSAIKVVDFGSSCRVNERIYSYIQSRFYRAPEIILNLEYSQAIDMWSLGCILVELHTGRPVFVGQFEHEQILRIIELMGMPPNHMLSKGRKTSKYFEHIQGVDGIVTYQPKVHRDRDNKKISFRGISSRSLTDVIGVYSGGPFGKRAKDPGHSSSDYEKFLDLVQKMLILDPELRIKPDAALKHPFFIRNVPSTNSENSSATQNPVQSSLVTMSNVSQAPQVSQMASERADCCDPDPLVEPSQTYLTYVGSNQDCVAVVNNDINKQLEKPPPPSVTKTAAANSES